MQLLSAMIRNTVRSVVKNEEGATMVEYGLMLALIAIICIVAVTAVGTKASSIFSTTAQSL